MKIDAHQHFWKYDPVRDAWITDEMSVIQRDFLPSDLSPLLKESGVEGCVAVQAGQSLIETDFLLDLAADSDIVKAVVGWVDLKSDNLTDVLDLYSDNPYFKGVRHILQAEPKGYMSSDDFVKGVSTLKSFDLSYDILSTESQLEEVLTLIQKLPEMRLVIDHISKPDIKGASFDHWAKYMKKIADHEHVSVKLSGLVTEADWGNWQANDFKQYIDFCLETFGSDRLMFGSDWPVCLLAGEYHQVYDLLKDALAPLSVSEQDLILGGVAKGFYKIDV